jgi:hypothetical protein
MSEQQQSKSKVPKYLLIGCGGLFLFLMFCGVIAALMGGGTTTSTQKTSNEPQKINSSNNNETSSTPTEEPKQEFYLAEEVKLSDRTLTAYAVQEVSGQSFNQPKEGMKFVAVDVMVKNGTDQPQATSTFDFKLQDESSYSYNSQLFDAKDPSYKSSTLQPGKQQRGWITFEVPKTAKEYELVYTPNTWQQSKQIVIKLKKK